MICEEGKNSFPMFFRFSWVFYFFLKYCYNIVATSTSAQFETAPSTSAQTFRRKVRFQETHIDTFSKKNKKPGKSEKRAKRVFPSSQIKGIRLGKKEKAYSPTPSTVATTFTVIFAAAGKTLRSKDL